MDSVEDLTAANVIDNIIVNAINTIRKNKKQPDETSTYKFLNKNLKNDNKDNFKGETNFYVQKQPHYK